jgi:transcriptional regulator with XRE-family HTH domain
MYGLNKPRTKFGHWIDFNGLSQREIEKMTRISRNTLSRICNNPHLNPQYNTKYWIISTLRKRGYDVWLSDFWD